MRTKETDRQYMRYYRAKMRATKDTFRWECPQCQVILRAGDLMQMATKKMHHRRMHRRAAAEMEAPAGGDN
eukprot:2899184-Pyramimonas_sp.AAC.1